MLIAGEPAAGQVASDAPQRFRETVSLDTDIAVTKKLKAVEDYLSAEQWEQAIDVLQEISSGNEGTLVALSPGRYVNASIYCNLLLSGLTREGLAVYRRKIDPQARRWFEKGRRTRDESLLRRVLRHGFVSSFGDDALLLLGEWAWERGELNVARSYWQQLLPHNAGPDQPALSPRYPDPDFGEAEILARLIVCSLAEANFTRAERERAILKQKHPDAKGKLAGRSGNLVQIVDALANQAELWTFPALDTTARTFALNAARNDIVPGPVDVGAERWSIRFSGRERGRYKFPVRQPAFPRLLALSVHPVVYGDIVLLGNANHIDAYNRHTGKPAWPGPIGEEDDATILRLQDDPFTKPPRPAVGVPRFTMTVHDGRLYARMGTPITSLGEHEVNIESESVLVILDLDPERGQGKLLAKISAGNIDRGGSRWSFEGSPVVSRNRVYVALRRSRPQMQFNVACFDGETGRLIWNRKVCAVVSNVGSWQSWISHQLLTLAENKLFFSTGVGAIVCLEANEGLPLWVVTYDSRPSASSAVLSDHTKQGLLPCLYHQGTVFAAPNDTDEILAIDAHSGVVTWRRRLKDRIRHLLGIGRGNLIVSGNSLWGLDARTGRIVWGRAVTDPEFYGYGRGLLVDDSVWWPTRQTIEIRSQRSGLRIHRQPILLDAHGTTAEPNTGGNLLITDGYLLVAQTDRLVAYWEYALPFKRRRHEISATTIDSSQTFRPQSLAATGHGPKIGRGVRRPTGRAR
jgi:outer membrane protein assembly factor BamB